MCCSVNSAWGQARSSFAFAAHVRITTSADLHFSVFFEQSLSRTPGHHETLSSRPPPTCRT